MVVSGAFFERRTWCRYLCFLGGLSGNYSRTGMLELRATPAKCAKCKVEACYKGNEKAPGCPMFEFPRTMDTNASCNLCGYCVKSCPNDSPRLTLRVAHPGAVVHPQAQVRGGVPGLVIMGIVFVQNITMLERLAGASWAGWSALPGPTSYFVTFTITFADCHGAADRACSAATALAASQAQRGSLCGRTSPSSAMRSSRWTWPGTSPTTCSICWPRARPSCTPALALFGQDVHGASPALLDSATIQVLQYILVVLGAIGSLYTAYRISVHGYGKARGCPASCPMRFLL